MPAIHKCQSHHKKRLRLVNPNTLDIHGEELRRVGGQLVRLALKCANVCASNRPCAHVYQHIILHANQLNRSRFVSVMSAGGRTVCVRDVRDKAWEACDDLK